MATHPIRKGVTPAARPTEWTAAAVMLANACVMFATDHNTAALVSVASACLPALATAAFSWYEARHVDAVVAAPAVTDPE